MASNLGDSAMVDSHDKRKSTGAKCKIAAKVLVLDGELPLLVTANRHNDAAEILGVDDWVYVHFRPKADIQK